MRTSLDHELKYLQSCAQELKSYLLSTELFWPTGLRAPRDMTPYPEMTLGNMLLSQVAGQAMAISHAQKPSQEKEWIRIQEQIDATRERWGAAWENKAMREQAYRLRQWAGYLNDLRSDFQNHGVNYPLQVRQRVLLELIGQELQRLHSGDQELNDLDKILRVFFQPGEFIWQKELAQVFSEKQYWYLWGRIVK